jgi:hypothetical protein
MLHMTYTYQKYIQINILYYKVRTNLDAGEKW